MFPYFTMFAEDSNCYYCVFLGEKLFNTGLPLLAEAGLLNELVVAASGVEMLLIMILLL
jgi:hypothetical protein